MGISTKPFATYTPFYIFTTPQGSWRSRVYKEKKEKGSQDVEKYGQKRAQADIMRSRHFFSVLYSRVERAKKKRVKHGPRGHMAGPHLKVFFFYSTPNIYNIVIWYIVHTIQANYGYLLYTL